MARGGCGIRGAAAAAVAALLLSGALLVRGQDAAPAAAFRERVAPFFRARCVTCHGPEKAESELRLDRLADSGPAADPAADRETWERVRDKLSEGLMPPESEPRPPAEEVARALAWIESRLKSAAPPAGRDDPGRVTMRRLNRFEYENTVRDLLGVSYDAQALFPADDVGYGFDSIGDVLSLPPLLMEKYLDAAERIAAEAIVELDPAEPPARRVPGKDL
ncbi:MAG: DUF1587 domain-containing protein, partial [Planctomycetales bacterium]|nr:DUF1587 domain-containing protein [Planctomycetales bacterium]